MAFKIPEGDQKSQYVQSSFTRIAAKYDLFNDLITQGMHRCWKNYVVQQAKLQQGDSVLDLCCGTGDITERLTHAVGDSGRVIGLDFSEGMLHVAISRSRQQHHNYIQADALKIPISSASMDAVTVGYGLRNLKELKPCLLEVRRILKPGGRFIILDMGKIKVPVAKELFRFYFFKVVPLVGQLLYRGEDMFDYFPESSVNYPSQEAMAQLLVECGFANVSFKNFHLGGTAVHYSENPQNL